MKVVGCKKLSFKLIIGLMCVTLLGCTKKRDAELAYGEDRELYKISNYEGQEYDLQTSEITESLQSDKNFKVIDSRKESAKDSSKNFGYVKFDSKDPLKLTDSTMMIGLPNHTYKVKYIFQADTLKVMKLGTTEELAPDEMPSAIDNKDGRFMVPIVSYTASYYSIDQRRNEYNEKTSRLELIALQSPMGASHFKIDLNSKKRAKYLPKTTVLPISFFEGSTPESKDWYFAVTMIGQNMEAQKGLVGSFLAYDQLGKEATRIRMIKNSKALTFYNLNVDERLENSLETRPELQSSVLSIAVDYKEFKFTESGKTTSVKEENNEDGGWKNRKFVELKLDEIAVAYDKDMIKSPEILDFQIDDGYLSILVKDEASGVTYRIALYRVDAYQKDATEKHKAQKYVPKTYLPDDMTVFGFFTSARNHVQDYETNSRSKAQKMIRLSRFNPTRQTIEYRLNMEAPEWAESVFKDTMAAWNASFQAAGLGIRIQYMDQNHKALRGYLGDLRYSLVNIFDAVDLSNTWYLGLGPSLTDFSGEIIMATSNLNVGGYMNSTKYILHQYIKTAKGDMALKSILGFGLPGLRIAVDPQQNALNISNTGNRNILEKKSSLPVFLNGKYQKGFKPQFEQKKAAPSSQQSAQMESSIDTVNPLTLEAVKDLCPELNAYLGNLISKTAGDEDIETDLVNKCAIKVVRPRLTSTLLHEIGHNLGLRHNFYASSDIANYFAPVQKRIGNQEKTIKWRSSSVMDYLPFDEDTMTQPGPYDIAAIRWGYSDTIESKDGQILKLNPQYSIRQQAAQKMKTYKYCTDENAYWYPTDPLCDTYDVGSDPVQIVENLKAQYNAHVAQFTFRNDRSRTMEMNAQAYDRYQRFIVPMLKYYEMWRLILARETGADNKYLEKTEKKEDYELLLKKVFDANKQGKSVAEWNKKFYDAKESIFKFLMKTALTPDYSCIATRGKGSGQAVQLFSFSLIQSEIFNRKGRTVKNCTDPDVIEFLKSEKSANLFAEGGKAFGSLFEEMSRPFEIQGSYGMQETPEVIGFAMDRYLAMHALTSRETFLYTSQQFNFTPNFMDEPLHREELGKAVIERLTAGIGIDSLELNKSVKMDIPKGQFSLNFVSEKELLTLMIPMFRDGLMIAGRDQLNSDRYMPYKITKKDTLLKEGGGDMECYDVYGTAYCALEKHHQASRLIKYLNELKTIRNTWKPSDNAVAIMGSLIAEHLPKNQAAADFQYIQIYELKEKFEKIANGDKNLEEDLSRLFMGIFGDEHKIYVAATSELYEKIVEKGETHEEQEKQKNILRRDKFLRWLKVFPIKDFKELDHYKNMKSYDNYVGLNFEIATRRFDELLKKQNEKAAEYQENSAEYDAQADILMNSLF